MNQLKSLRKQKKKIKMSKIYCHKCRQVHEKGECMKQPTLIDKSIEDRKKAQRKKTYKTYKTYDEMNEEELKIQKFYNSKDWRKKREEILSRSNGLCVTCWSLGRVRSASSVHHIVKLVDDFDLRLDDNNLIAVCRECHELCESSCDSLEEIEKLINKLKKEKNKFD